MSIWGRNERSWRKRHKRAVSPIIATILLVAITVVLAAVLYILIQNYTKTGSAGTPIGTTLSVAQISPGVKVGANYLYNFSLQNPSASVGLTTGNMQLKVITAGGATVATVTTLLVQSFTGATQATWTFSTSSWDNSGVIVQSGQTFVVTSTATLVGDSLIVSGIGAFSGSYSSPTVQ